MEIKAKKRLSRNDWVRGALEILQERGVDGVKIVVIAERLDVTSGSFYWHFKDLRELLECLLDYWETELTDAIIVVARNLSGSAEDRILTLMQEVIATDAAAYDHVISVWARSDPKARETYERTIQKRFEFAAWMFRQAGFNTRQAAVRGRLMVTYLMGESSISLKSNRKWRSIVRDEFDVLIRPAE
ncbi:MAG: TetR/AcrR family transcriptional regulator [Hyphomicrobiales bacterium]